jgi:hypothetical protein
MALKEDMATHSGTPIHVHLRRTIQYEDMTSVSTGIIPE